MRNIRFPGNSQALISSLTGRMKTNTVRPKPQTIDATGCFSSGFRFKRGGQSLPLIEWAEDGFELMIANPSVAKSTLFRLSLWPFFDTHMVP